jgi:diguanylate cyclase (GGDEF)-like protein
MGPPSEVSEHDALMRVAAAAAGAHDLDQVLELTAEEARVAIGAASLAISRWDRATNILTTLINVGDLGPGEQPFPEREIYDVGKTPKLQRLLLQGQPYFNAVDDPRSEAGAVTALRAREKDSEVAVPIVVEGESWGEVWAATAHGRPRFRATDVRFLEAIAGQLAVTIGRAELFSRVSRMAYEDTLTGLANRRALEERLVRASTRAEERDTDLAVLLCDLDRLKTINDERGHEAGDRALRRVGEALVSAAADHPGSFVGRLSGDEFCVVLEGQDLGAARDVAGAALRALAGDLDMPVSISCGAAARGAATRTREQILRAADAAQYAAKRKGGGQVCTAAPGREPFSADERRVFRGSPDERLRTAIELLQSKFEGELCDVSVLTRLEALATTAAEAVNAAAWTISHVPAGASAVRSITTANSRDERLAGVRVGLEDEVYPLADYPATASLVERGSGAFLTSCDDPLADVAECKLLKELGYDSVLVAVAPDEDGSWLLEIYGDDATSGLPEGRAPLAVLVRAAVPPKLHSAAEWQTHEHRAVLRHELLLAISHRLSRGGDEIDSLETVVEELSRAYDPPICAIFRLRSDVRLEVATFRSEEWVAPGWTQSAYAGLVGRCMRERQPVMAGDVNAEPDYRQHNPALGIESELDVPILVGDEPWGAINLASREPNGFDSEDARVVQAVAAQLGAALLRVRSGDAIAAS